MSISDNFDILDTRKPVKSNNNLAPNNNKKISSKKKK